MGTSLEARFARYGETIVAAFQSTCRTRRLPPARGWGRCSAISRSRSRPYVRTAVVRLGGSSQTRGISAVIQPPQRHRYSVADDYRMAESIYPASTVAALNCPPCRH